LNHAQTETTIQKNENFRCSRKWWHMVTFTFKGNEQSSLLERDINLLISWHCRTLMNTDTKRYLPLLKCVSGIRSLGSGWHQKRR
jgi:hypothetical protein